jgi:PIN domain nuclease of toxin-antitoxin system
MNLLLDTHALIWYTEGSDKLSSKAKFEIDNKFNSKFISIGLLWEVAIKASKNKLEIKQTFEELNHFIFLNGIQILGIEFSHLNILLELPHHHGDPFDRLLIAQAISEKLTIVSADRHFAAYPVEVIW